jgi:hypothetical protein
MPFITSPGVAPWIRARSGGCGCRSPAEAKSTGGPAGRFRERSAGERSIHPGARRHRRRHARPSQTNVEAGPAQRPDAASPDSRGRRDDGGRRPAVPAVTTRPRAQDVAAAAPATEAGATLGIQGLEDSVLEASADLVGGAERGRPPHRRIGLKAGSAVGLQVRSWVRTPGRASSCNSADPSAAAHRRRRGPGVRRTCGNAPRS